MKGASAKKTSSDYDKSKITECEYRPLRIVCGDNSAWLYLSRICTGSSGHCILYGKSWLTPNEFQAISGRKAAKDWKRSIKHNGKSLKILICTKTLTLEPPSCICEKCVGISMKSNGNKIGKQIRSEVDRPRETKATASKTTVAKNVTLNLTTNEQVAAPRVVRGRRKQLVAAKRTKRTKPSRLAGPLSGRRNTRSTSRRKHHILTCGKTGIVIHSKRRSLSTNMSASPQAKRKKNCQEKLSERNIKRTANKVTASRLGKGVLPRRIFTRKSRITAKSGDMGVSELNEKTMDNDDDGDDCVALINLVKADKLDKICVNNDNRSCLSEVDFKEMATTVCVEICNLQNEPKRQSIVSSDVVDVPRSLVDKTDNAKPTEEICGDKSDFITSGPVTLHASIQPDSSSADSAGSGHRVEEPASNHYITDAHENTERQEIVPGSDKLSSLSTQKESRLLSIIQELKTYKRHLLANRAERKQVATQTKCDLAADVKVHYGCPKDVNVVPRTHVDVVETTVDKNDGFPLPFCPTNIPLTHASMAKRDKPTAAVIGHKSNNTENRETIGSNHVGEQKAIARVNDTCYGGNVHIAQMPSEKNTTLITLLNNCAKKSPHIHNASTSSEKVSRISQNSDTKQQVKNYLAQEILFDGVQNTSVADVLDLRVSKQDKISEIVPCANSGRQTKTNRIKNSKMFYQYGRQLPKNMRTWSVDDVHCFILSMPGCGHFAKVFRDHSITGRLLRNLSVTQLTRVLRIDQRIAEAVRWRVDQILVSSRDRATLHRVDEVKSRPTIGYSCLLHLTPS